MNAVPQRGSELGSGTVLAMALGLLVMLAAAWIVLLSQAAIMASRASASADLAALAAADAARGITAGEPCRVAEEVARRNGARMLNCAEGAGSTVLVRTELIAGTIFGAATGDARAGPPQDRAADPGRQAAGPYP